MSEDNVSPLRRLEEPTVENLAAALESHKRIAGRAFEELARLGEGLTALRDEWKTCEFPELRCAADRLHLLLVRRP